MNSPPRQEQGVRSPAHAPDSSGSPSTLPTLTASASPVGSRRTALAAWVRAHKLEFALVAVGLVLRFSIYLTYNVTLGYDYPTHHQYVRYLVEHHELPPFDLNVATYHPPLYYLLAALIESSGFTPQATAWIAIVASSLQLLLLSWGLQRYLPRAPRARALALAVAVVVPANVHIAGMVSNEALSDLFCTGAALLLSEILIHRGHVPAKLSIAAGLLLGCALMTKISAVMVIVAFVLAVVVAVGHRARRHPVSPLLKAASMVLIVAAVVGGWPYARLRLLHSQWILTGYDQWSAKDPTKLTPYLDRRTLGYFVAWDFNINGHPYWAAGIHPHPRFWPVLVGTTFSDYYNFAYVSPPGPKEESLNINGKPLRPSAMMAARLSVAGGTALAVFALAAWLASARSCWRGRDHARFLLLLVGLAAVAGQLHFSIAHPYDGFGPIKGAYLQFAEPIYCALAGIGMTGSWRWRRFSLPPRFVRLVGVTAIGLVALYTLFARVFIPLLT